jgi:hypothetical protein
MKPMAKHKKRTPKVTEKKRGWMIVGADTSMSSIALAAISYDAVMKKLKGPVFVIKRWSKEDDYFSRLKDASKASDLVLDLQHEMGLSLATNEIFICQEEPWPTGMVGFGKSSGFLKQQAEVSGAFLGGLVAWGFQNIVQINSTKWRQMVAADLGITIHHSKWRSPELALRFNCKPADSGKFRSKEWALGPWMGSFFENGGFPNEIPDLPDIIESSKHGKIPRPEESKAKAVQPADEYDALAIAWTMYGELRASGELDN